MQQILVERESSAVVLVVRGELDAFTAPALGDAFADAVAGGDRLVVDLSCVSFMDSTALGLIVRSVNELVDRGGYARVVLPETNARRIFEITTLDRILPVAMSRAEALVQIAD